MSHVVIIKPIFTCLFRIFFFPEALLKNNLRCLFNLRFFTTLHATVFLLP